MIDDAQQDNFCWHSSKSFVIHPSVVWDLILDDKLDGYFVPFDTVIRGHNKAVTPTTQFILKLVGLGELRIELVASWELCRIGGRVGGELEDGWWSVFGGRLREEFASRSAGVVVIMRQR